uniref:Uncharacterized protein n=1 Tax=Magallana gigas TaxID=29159 RepID=A0A8W8HMS5_MAGGI
MAFTFAAFCYILALILTAVLIFFAIFHLVLPEYFIHILFTFLFITAMEWFTVLLNIPLIIYHIRRICSSPIHLWI